MTQFGDQIKIKLISQLISGISIVLQESYGCFNGTAILEFTIPKLLVSSKKSDLKLNDLEFSTLSAGSSLYYCHKLPDILLNYRYILTNYTLVLQQHDL